MTDIKGVNNIQTNDQDDKHFNVVNFKHWHTFKISKVHISVILD